MPVITLDGPAVTDVAKKRTLVEEVTRAAAACYGLPPESIVILLKENRTDNVAVGGTLISDRPKP